MWVDFDHESQRRYPRLAMHFPLKMARKCGIPWYSLNLETTSDLGLILYPPGDKSGVSETQSAVQPPEKKVQQVEQMRNLDLSSHAMLTFLAVNKSFPACLHQLLIHIFHPESWPSAGSYELVGVHFGWPTQNPGRKDVFQEGKSEQVTKNGFIVYCDIILVSLSQIKQSQYWNHVHEPLRMLRAANCGWLKSIICIGIYWSYKIIEPYRFGRVAKNIYRWGKTTSSHKVSRPQRYLQGGAAQS